MGNMVGQRYNHSAAKKRLFKSGPIYRKDADWSDNDLFLQPIIPLMLTTFYSNLLIEALHVPSQHYFPGVFSMIEKKKTYF